MSVWRRLEEEPRGGAGGGDGSCAACKEAWNACGFGAVGGSRRSCGSGR